MIATNPLSPVFQGLFDGVGQILALLYRAIPSYGIDIILLTLLIRIVLFPLAVKQIKSMQAMQVIQPKMKAIQQKYKGRRDAESRAKMNQEMMRLYKEHGASPFSGCLPLLLQFPVLITLFYVLQFPKGLTHIPHSNANPVVGQPQDSRLYVDIVHQKTGFLGMNLLCSAREAGGTVSLDAKTLKAFPDAPKSVNCGHGGAVRIPYYVFLAAMIGTTYFMQRQMQRASPVANPQQQMITRIMPVFFGYLGFFFPASLVIYWTTTNLVQIGQQAWMMPRYQVAGAKGAAQGKGPRSGNGQGTGGKPGQGRGRGGSAPPRGEGTGGDPQDRAGRGTGEGQGPRPGQRGNPGGRRGKAGGGRSGGDRKKRPKR